MGENVSWILDAIESAAVDRAAEDLVKNAKFDFASSSIEFRLEITFGEDMPFIRVRYEDAERAALDAYPTCPSSQVEHLGEVIAGLRDWADRLEPRLAEAQAAQARAISGREPDVAAAVVGAALTGTRVTMKVPGGTIEIG